MKNDADANKKAMDLMIKRGVIAKDITINDLAKLSSEIMEISPGGELAAWTFIGPNYVYTGD